MLKSKTTNIGGGYRILTEFVSDEWIEYRLFKGDYNLAWCTKPRGEGGRVEVWKCSDDAESYREYLNSGFVRYPFL